MPKKIGPHGFSLIELMVVISIVGFITALSLPTYVTFKIHAARAETNVFMRTIFAAAQSYHAENSIYPAGGSIGPTQSAGDEEPVQWVGCQSPHTDGMVKFIGGLKEETCMGLRYTYQFDPAGGNGNLSDVSRIKYFTILALSHYGLADDAPPERWGNHTPTLLCKSPNPYYKKWYMDGLSMFESGVIQPWMNNPIYDAAKSCLK